MEFGAAQGMIGVQQLQDVRRVIATGACQPGQDALADVAQRIEPAETPDERVIEGPAGQQDGLVAALDPFHARDRAETLFAFVIDEGVVAADDLESGLPGTQRIVALLAIAAMIGAVQESQTLECRPADQHTEADGDRQARVAAGRDGFDQGTETLDPESIRNGIVRIGARYREDGSVVGERTDQGDARVARRAGEQFLDPAGGDDRVRVEQDHIAGRRRQSPVHVADEAEILVGVRDRDTRLMRLQCVQPAQETQIAAGIVEYADRTVRRRMREHAVETAPDRLVTVEDRDQDFTTLTVQWLNVFRTIHGCR
ncbi:hypothetical protein Atep_04170 [Allochromatium tepidum]|uniref:Uncharacterized protein n=1 Tax=Allochromatium tepidum TaxID=553982 RepID=A0ABN6G6X0_9GAMM|nr:hypothetical protein Atep_04170 [Allochromatium tepidum]